MLTLETINTIGIIGGGVMGNGIALVAAAAGYQVMIYDINLTAIDTARRNIENFLEKSVQKQKIDLATQAARLSRISYTTTIDTVQADFIIEAVIEKLEIKQQLLSELEGVNKPHTIFASNTSSIPITRIAAALQYPERFAGMHFFNPPQLMKLVEVIAGEATAPEVVKLISDLAVKMGKVPAVVKDSPGFIVNRVARHFYLEALRCVEEGVADIETVDRLMEATGFRMGPFKLMDLIGVDTNHAVTQSLYNGFFQEPRFRPSRLQQKKVEAGYFGKKNGKGFYTYDKE